MIERYFYIKNIRNLLLISFVVLNSSFNAQQLNEREIKLSGKYYWGEGIRDSLEQAKSDAIADLQFKISATVNSQSESKVSESGDVVSAFFNKNVKVYSTIKLKGVEFFVKTHGGNKYKVVAFLSKEKYRETISEIANDVTTKAEIAEEKESTNGIISAINDYYSAYLMTYLSPDAIPFNSKTYNQQYSNIRFFLETKVKTFLAEISIEQDSLWIEPGADDLVNVSLNVTYLKLNADNLDLRFDIPGNPAQKVEDGKAKLFLYSQPSNVKEKYKIRISMPKPDNPELSSFHEQFCINDVKKIELDFSPIVSIDYKVTKLPDGSFMFEAVVKNLSVSSLKWNIDNGVSSEDVKFIYRFVDKKSHKVTLTINNSKLLTISKFVDSQGNVNEILITKKEVDKIDPIVKELMKYKTYDTIIKKVVENKNSGKLIFSLKRSDFINLNNCYGIVIDINTREVAGFFTPGGEKRIDLLTKEEFSDYSKRYKGKGIIWFQLN